MKNIFLLLSLLISSIAQAQLPVLVRNIDTINGEGCFGGISKNFIVYNNKLLFLANDAKHGYELWVSDNTKAGTRLVQNSDTAGDGTFNEPVLCNGRIIYRGTDNNNGTEPWITDGTGGGTALLKDIAGGTGTSSARNFTTLGTNVFFAADDHVYGLELWITDGGPAGTKRIKDINTGIVAGITGNEMIAFNGKVYFAANDGSNGTELWASDGTTAGTIMLKDINAGSPGSNPSMFKIFNSKLCFQATDNNGTELWTTDGTTGGTAILKDINPGTANSNPQQFSEYNGKLYFAAGSSAGAELWVTDGTKAGTLQVKDICPGNCNSAPAGIYVYHNRMYFSADNGTGHPQMWTSDGTAAGTSLFKTLYPNGDGSISFCTTYHDKLYFEANDMSGRYQLWVSNGTADSTIVLRPSAATHASGIIGGPLNVVGKSLLFPAIYDNVIGYELYSLTTPDTILPPPASIAAIPSLSDARLYPNPATESITIQYALTQAGTPAYRLYDINGRCVGTWNEQQPLTGKHTKQLSIAHLPPATYCLQIEANGTTRSLPLIKQ